MLLAAAAMAIAAASGESIPFAVGPIGVMGMATALLLLSVGVLSTAGEWTHRTVQTTFMLVPHRGRVLAAVAAALSTSVLALMLGDQLSWNGAGRALATVVAAGAVFAVTGAGRGRGAGECSGRADRACTWSSSASSRC